MDIFISEHNKKNKKVLNPIHPRYWIDGTLDESRD